MIEGIIIIIIIIAYSAAPPLLNSAPDLRTLLVLNIRLPLIGAVSIA
jgi:hypothetical protein